MISRVLFMGNASTGAGNLLCAACFSRFTEIQAGGLSFDTRESKKCSIVITRLLRCLATAVRDLKRTKRMFLKSEKNEFILG